MTNDIHVHLSKAAQVRWGHLISWFIPQIKNGENKLCPLDPGIGEVTNNVDVISADNRLRLSTPFYNIAIVLDMSPSIFTVDMDNDMVIFEEVRRVLRSCLKPIAKPSIHPWSDKGYELDITLSVVAYTPQFPEQYINVLLQGFPLVEETTDYVIRLLDQRCKEMGDHVRKKAKEVRSKSESQCNPGIVTLVKDVLDLLNVQRSRSIRIPDEEENSDVPFKSDFSVDNSKTVILMVTDAVVGVGSAYNTTDIVINHLHSRQTSCSFVRVGPADPRNYGFGYVPNLSLLQFVSHASGGHLWEWKKDGNEKILFENILHWSPYYTHEDKFKGLLQKTIIEHSIPSISLTSMITKKIYEGYKIEDVKVKSEIAKDFSGTEITTIYVNLRLQWGKRIHVFYELSSDLPLSQGGQNIKVAICIRAEYDIMQFLMSMDGRNFRNLKYLLDFLESQSQQCKDPSNRWTRQLHNYAQFHKGKTVSYGAENLNKPIKVERIPHSNDKLFPEDRRTFNDFWLQLLGESDFIDGNFDTYRLKCWLQFDLNFPKCLTGRASSNRNKELQAYTRSQGFLIDPLEKWSTITIGGDKTDFVQQYEIKDNTVEYKSSFIWVKVYVSCQCISFYIAFHRDIPFPEQQQVRKDLIEKLLGVKFQGSHRLDDSVRIGLDGTMNKRISNFIPFDVKANYACVRIPKPIDEIMLWNVNNQNKMKWFQNLYLHKLICNWKTCPDVNCCSDDLIKELRNEIFNALFRLRLQEEYKPVMASGKVLSFHKFLNMDHLSDENTNVRGQVCLLQYIITVDDESLVKSKDTRKISSTFTTEVVIEPQWGKVNMSDVSNLAYIDGCESTHVPSRIFELDFQMITSLCTFATIRKLCTYLDKHQPEFSHRLCPKPSSFKRPVVEPEIPYLFLVSSLLSKSLLNTLTIPLINIDSDSEDRVSPSAKLIYMLSEQFSNINKRHVELSTSEVDSILEMVERRQHDEFRKVNKNIPCTAWKCYVRFHTRGENEDTSRLHFTLLPQPPDDFTEKQLREWFPDNKINIMFFDCFYKVLIGTYTNIEKCSDEIIHRCDQHVDSLEELAKLGCPSVLSEILASLDESAHREVLSRDAAKCNYINNVAKAVKRSYIFGIHYGLQNDIPVKKSCVDLALGYITDCEDGSYAKKEVKKIPLSKYFQAVCSHVSGLKTCCSSDRLNYSGESEDVVSQVNSECYIADVESTSNEMSSPDIIQEGHLSSVSCSIADAETKTPQNRDSDSDGYLSTPLQNDNNWSVPVSFRTGSLAAWQDVYTGEIISASSTELTPINAEYKFDETLRQKVQPDIVTDSEDSHCESEQCLASINVESEERKVSFAPFHDNSSSSSSPWSPNGDTTTGDAGYDNVIMQVMTSTCTPELDTGKSFFTETHASIREKFDSTIKSHFMSIAAYSDEFLIMKPHMKGELDSIGLADVSYPLFLKISSTVSGVEKVITSIPTCIYDVIDRNCSYRNKDFELTLTFYTLPELTSSPPSSSHHSFTPSIPRPSVSHRRKDSARKLEKSDRGSRSNQEDTDDTDHNLVTSSKTPHHRTSRTSTSRDSVSSPIKGGSLYRQETIMDPVADFYNRILDTIYRDIEWLIQDQHINNLRRKSTVTVETLKQVLSHCQQMPLSVRNCRVRTENLCYVDSWSNKEENDKTRYDQLLSKIQLEEWNNFRLCRIDHYFYYTLLSENDQTDVSGREALSTHSSISSIGSVARSSQYRSSASSSSLADETNPDLKSSCNWRPCANYWIVVQVLCDRFHVAFHKADEVSDDQIDEDVIDTIVKSICLLNKIQNQEFLLQNFKATSICPKELLPNSSVYNSYVCDVVHRITVYLWDMPEADGLKVINETLLQLKAGNTDIDPVYIYQNQVEDSGSDSTDSKTDNHVRSIFYFQLPKPRGDVVGEDKVIILEVRGLEEPDPKRQLDLDKHVQQKFESTKLESIAKRLNRNPQTKLTREEVKFLSSKNSNSDKTVFCAIPEYVNDFLPHFWFYFNQHLTAPTVQLFNPKYSDAKDSRIHFKDESTGKEVETKDQEVYISLKFAGNRNNASGHVYPRRLNQDPEFQSLLMVNVTLVDKKGFYIDINNCKYLTQSPVFNTIQDPPPSAKPNESISFTEKLDGKSEVNLKLRIIEKRKKPHKGGPNSQSFNEFEKFLSQSAHAAFISLLLEIYILPADLVQKSGSMIVGVGSMDVAPSTPSSNSLSLTQTVFKMKSRRSSSESLDNFQDKERLRRKQGAGGGSKDSDSTLNPILGIPCIEACKVGAQLKTKVVEHQYVGIPSRFVCHQVINRITEGLSGQRQFKVRIFRQVAGGNDYKMLNPPTDKVKKHTLEEIENFSIILIARYMEAFEDSQAKLRDKIDSDAKNDEKFTIDLGILDHMSNTIPIGCLKVAVPRQVHIVFTLQGKKLNMWFYNLHKHIKDQFIGSIKELIMWLHTRSALLNRILLFKCRHDSPDNLNHGRRCVEILPETEEELEKFLEQKEPPPTTPQQHNSFKSKVIEGYERIYELYHPGLLTVKQDVISSRHPLDFHGNQLRAFMRASKRKEEEMCSQVNLTELDPGSLITKEQAKALRKNARLLHYIASPLLFSPKLKPSVADKETFAYVINPLSPRATSDEPHWFIHFKKQLFDKFISYLKDAKLGVIHMMLLYEGDNKGSEVEVSKTFNDDDNEALLFKETEGGKILLGVLIQNSTFCVKLYGFDADQSNDCLKLFQECTNLKTQTHTNSFNYDWMIHSIYDSIKESYDPSKMMLRLPVHQCLKAVVEHYEQIPEPPHIRSWLKRITEFVWKCDTKYLLNNFRVFSIFDYLVENKEDFGLTLLREGKQQELGKNRDLLVLRVKDKLSDYKFAIFLSKMTDCSSPLHAKVTYYIVLATQYINAPASGPNIRDSSCYFHLRSDPPTGFTKLPTDNVSSSDNDSVVSNQRTTPPLFTSRPRINSQLSSCHERKQELYHRAVAAAETEITNLLKHAYNVHYRDILVRKLTCRNAPSSTLSLERSYHSFTSRDDTSFTYDNLRELLELSFSTNLLNRKTPIFKIISQCSQSRYKKLVAYLKGKTTIVTTSDGSLDSGASSRGGAYNVAIAIKRTPTPCNKQKVSIVVMKHNANMLDVFAVVKNKEDVTDQEHIGFWERILTWICVFVWERLWTK